MSPSPNPFAPPAAVDVVPYRESPLPVPTGGGRGWGTSLAIWSLVCIVSAAPSFAWGMGTIASEQILAMCLGVAIFVLLYTAADQLTQRLAWRRASAASLTLKIGYVARMMISVIFPIGASLDVICGIFSVQFVNFFASQWLPPAADGSARLEQAGFGVTLLITLTQGVVLNIVLFLFMLLVYGIVVLSQHRGRSATLGEPVLPS